MSSPPLQESRGKCPPTDLRPWLQILSTVMFIIFVNRVVLYTAACPETPLTVY